MFSLIQHDSVDTGKGSPSQTAGILDESGQLPSMAFGQLYLGLQNTPNLQLLVIQSILMLGKIQCNFKAQCALPSVPKCGSETLSSSTGGRRRGEEINGDRNLIFMH